MVVRTGGGWEEGTVVLRPPWESAAYCIRKARMTGDSGQFDVCLDYDAECACPHLSGPHSAGATDAAKPTFLP